MGLPFSTGVLQSNLWRGDASNFIGMIEDVQNTPRILL